MYKLKLKMTVLMTENKANMSSYSYIINADMNSYFFNKWINEKEKAALPYSRIP